MKRLFGSAFVAFVVFGCTAGTSSEVRGIGDPCVPQMERDATFTGFDEKEVNLETASPSCSSGVCLANHFRGRVSCPYGQSAEGAAPAGASACATPDTMKPVIGSGDPRKKALVPPQCVDRAADKAVYCSCRCANGNGRTDDAQVYCACPDGFQCTSLVSSIGSSTANLAGSYCVKIGTVYDANTACSQGDCDPAAKSCR